MQQPGRKSGHSLGIIIDNNPQINAAKRLPPPDTLQPDEVAIWVSIVDDQPVGAFTVSDIPLLEMFCGHTARCRVLSQILYANSITILSDDDEIKQYERTARLLQGETRAASSLATRLRIARNTITDATTIARRAAKGRVQSAAIKPWETEGDE